MPLADRLNPRKMLLEWIVIVLVGFVIQYNILMMFYLSRIYVQLFKTLVFALMAFNPVEMPEGCLVQSGKFFFE